MSNFAEWHGSISILTAADLETEAVARRNGAAFREPLVLERHANGEWWVIKGESMHSSLDLAVAEFLNRVRGRIQDDTTTSVTVVFDTIVD